MISSTWLVAVVLDTQLSQENGHYKETVRDKSTFHTDERHAWKVAGAVGRAAGRAGETGLLQQSELCFTSRGNRLCLSQTAPTTVLIRGHCDGEPLAFCPLVC